MGATIIDFLVLIIPIGIVAALAGSAVGTVLEAVLSAAYVTLMLSRKGQTVGHMALSTRVVDTARGGVPSVEKALIRWSFEGVFSLVAAICRLNNLGGLSLLFSLPILVDYLWPLWDRQNQTLHDKIAGTFVLRTFS